MHERILISDEELSDSEENPLIDEVSIVEHRRKSSTVNMKNRIFVISIIFLVLLSVHILIFNNVKIYSRREVPGWSKNTSRETSDYILPNENTTLIEPLLCREPDPIFLLIVVCSSVNNFEARQSIRESWGNTSEFNYPMFEKLHGRNGTFLNINNKHWLKYVEVKVASCDDEMRSRNTFVIESPELHV
jgi:beta-1,3-galactosyltransferase 1